jgi:hypothetical protein
MVYMIENNKSNGDSKMITWEEEEGNRDVITSFTSLFEVIQDRVDEVGVEQVKKEIEIKENV